MVLNDEQKYGLLQSIVQHQEVDYNQVPAITKMIDSLGQPEVPEAQPEAEPMTKAKWSKLIKDDGITSLIDGKSYKTMKRHLASHGHTAESYKDAFGLPSDFPMVSPDYSQKRSEMAKAFGLGGQRQGSR